MAVCVTPVYRSWAPTYSASACKGRAPGLGLMQRTKWGVADSSLLNISRSEFCSKFRRGEKNLMERGDSLRWAVAPLCSRWLNHFLGEGDQSFPVEKNPLRTISIFKTYSWMDTFYLKIKSGSRWRIILKWNFRVNRNFVPSHGKWRQKTSYLEIKFKSGWKRPTFRWNLTFEMKGKSSWKLCTFK